VSRVRAAFVAMTAVALVTTVACNGSSKSSGGGGGAGGSDGKTFTVGILTDLTGLAASGNKTSVDGVKAGVVAAKRDGYTIKYVVADTKTTPDGALAAAKDLVRQKVFVVVAHSALAYAGAAYLASQHIPVVGVAEDGPEWITSKNMFSVFGALHTEKVTTTYGKFFKAQGVTTVGALGYSISPASANAAKAAIVSAEAVGLKKGYLNANFTFGSTNVDPIAIAMKNAKVDGMTATVDPNTGFALITALRQRGDPLKVALLPTGYGGDLLQAGPSALQAAQNVYFTLSYEPVEMQTTATKAFQADLQAAGVTGAPTFAEYNGYSSVLLLVEGLKAAGAKPTQASVITGLSGIHAFNPGGLFGSHPLDINDRDNLVSGPDNCQWITKLSGDKFQLVSGADPVCGEVVAGKKV
jgi:ABC-type branched-subunit amino acid transport system substrate-binding protein